MAQKWEYKFVQRVRDIAGTAAAAGWKVYDDGKSMGIMGGDVAVLSAKLGEEGWELVSVTPRSSTVSLHGTQTAGVTTDELWVFKRAK